MTGPRYGTLFDRSEPTAESFWISLRYFNLYRIAVAGLFAGSTLVYGDALALGSHQLALFRGTSAVYLVAGIVFHLVLRNLRDRFNLQLSLHVCVDIVAISLLMYASGGLRSGIGVMLLISLIGAALVSPRRLTFLYAALAAIALLLEQSYWILVFDAPIVSYFQPGLLAMGFFASAGVTGWLAQRVSANERLAKQRGRELETQMRVNQLVIEDMHDGVVVVDQDGRVVQHNPQAQRLLGGVPLRGLELVRVLPGFQRRWLAWRAADGAAPLLEEDLEVHGRGIRVRMIETGTAEELSVLFLEDTTRSREQAQQIKLAALGRLTANIAHEIRNPLAAISHASELLGEKGTQTDTERLTRIIADNTRRLERLVADVLQLNRRDRAAQDRVVLPTWLTGFVEEFVANENVPLERFVVITAPEATIAFDREHLRQVMWNLLRNAVRFATPARGSVRIVVSHSGEQIELNVIDDGPGVAESEQGKLFEPFFTTDSKGTGLGLYLARELCAANRAWLEYVEGSAGGHFRIRCREALNT